ncbi:MAG: tellurium resistance protein TerC [Caulobacterales bacterium 68-7]|nr:TerC family protein [Caulobacterales bacterium]OJU12419.1 MAG: tellurium resistance protein TerC [Caulobacterales bacterium 68-7]
MLEMISGGDWAASFSAFLQVLMIDLVLAGDNAVAVGLAAGGLPEKDRKKVIFYGLLAAVVMRIGFALITTWLLGLIGLLLAGGILLLWVCWKMWREMRDQAAHEEAQANAALDDDPNTVPIVKKAKTFKQAFFTILIADLSMSIDNVLAVAGAARDHQGVLVFGLLLSVLLMGVAATWIAKLLHKHRWIGYVGLIIVLYVALHMIWEGHRAVVVDLDKTDAYNAAAPSIIDIGPEEVARDKAH